VGEQYYPKYAALTSRIRFCTRARGLDSFYALSRNLSRQFASPFIIVQPDPTAFRQLRRHAGQARIAHHPVGKGGREREKIDEDP
jgi:hypothetical protein